MANDHEQRIAALEREMTEVKAQLGAMSEDMRNIPDLIRVEFRFTNAQLARLQQQVEAMPRALAEILRERNRNS